MFLIPSAPASALVEQWGEFSETPADTLVKPTPVFEGLAGVVGIDAGNSSAYALTSTGEVYAWGDNSKGQLGDGKTEAASRAEPVKVKFRSGVKIVAIGEGKDDGYAVDSEGNGWGWGFNQEGSLCLGKGAVQDEPVKVPGTGSGKEVEKVQAGENHVLWLFKNGEVESCGNNRQGQLGVGNTVTTSNELLGVTFPKEASKIVEISAGNRTSAARDSEGRLFMWGANEEGQVGVGKGINPVYTPEKVLEHVTQVSAGGNLSENGHTLALVEGGEVWGWGSDAEEAIGDESTETKYIPTATKLKSTGGFDFKQVVASGKYSLGLTESGYVYAWGAASGYALGNGEKTGRFGRPVEPPLEDDGSVTAISGTYTDSLASTEGSLGG